MTSVEHVAPTSAGLAITIGGRATTLSWRWIRDHGEDPASFDPVTRQRRIYVLDSPDPAPASEARRALVDGVSVVQLSWPEAPEQTWISQATLVEVLAPATKVTAPVWHHAASATPTPVAVDDALTDDAALSQAIADLSTFGFAQLTGFVGAHDEVAALANRLGYPQTTIFGATWELSSELADHDDTAYSQTYLAPHTDGTYSDHAPGLQMFCCVERSGTGGESIVVDGFAIAETLRTEHQADFDVLTSVLVPAHYLEPGVELRASRPAIRLDQADNVVQISMNNYDRSPMSLPPAEMHAFYQAYGKLHDLANDQDRWFAVRLEPGDVLVNDNWRVLHGRQAYTGARRFFGCYIGHEAFESRCRTLLGA